MPSFRNQFISSLTIFLFILAMILNAFAPSRAFAGPKSKLCKPDICIFKREIPKALRSLITEGAQAVTKVKVVPVTPPFIDLPLGENEPLESKMLVPASRKINRLCGMLNGQLQCFDVVSFENCPTSLPVRDEGGRTYQCELECTTEKPDANGNCDCQVRYDKCELVG